MIVNTAVVWLLISVGSTGTREGRPTNVVERFADRAECIRVMEFLNGAPTGSIRKYSHIHTCVDARIAVLPK